MKHFFLTSCATNVVRIILLVVVVAGCLSILFSKLADGTKIKDFAMVVKSLQYKKLVLIFLYLRN